MKLHPHQRYIEALQKGNDTIIQEIYTTFFPNIEHFIKKNRGTKEDAYDVFQEGLQQLYTKATGGQNFVIQKDLSNWLFIVCRHIWYKKLKKKKQTPITFGKEIDPIEEKELEQQLIDNEKKQLYLKHFQRLSDKCRKVLQLFFDKRKMKEIAVLLGYENAQVARNKKAGCQKRLVQLIRGDRLFKELKN